MSKHCSRAHAESSAQVLVSLALALAVGAAWLLGELYGLFWVTLPEAGPALALAGVIGLTWLQVGLFIVAHDCMHGSLLPGMPRLNRRLGQLFLLGYAALDYDALCPMHHAHHRFSGTVGDPDAAPVRDSSFARWYTSFFLRYASAKQLLVICVIFWSLVLFLDAPLQNALLFWALPALLSSVQLFYFGTYLPHRHGAPAFVDAHRARSNDYPAWLSLITCFHFGYHHEHHAYPSLPWWRLPRAKRMRSSRSDPPSGTHVERAG